MTDEQPFLRQGILHIRIEGSRDDIDRFDGFAITSRDDGGTLISVPVADQAAVYGVLGTIRDLGLPLLLAVRTECPCRKTNCPRRAHCEECATYHGAKGKLPYCFRAKTGWDRQCSALTQAR